MNNIVITGYGCVVPAIGRKTDQPAPDFLATDCGAEARVDEEPGFVKNFYPEKYIAESQLRRFDRFSQIALVALKKAIASAGLTLTPEIGERAGLVMNTCFGPLHTITQYLKTIARNGPKLAPAGLFPFTVYNAFTGLLTCEIKALGTNLTIVNSSSLACGFNAIRQGTDDVMMTGGCDELLPEVLHSFSTCTTPGRSGIASASCAKTMALSEAAAVLVLEKASFTRARGAHAIAEVVSYGSVNALLENRFSYDISADSIALAVRQCLELAGLKDNDVSVITCGGNGLPALDAAEAEAMGKIFHTTPGPAVLNLKQCLGETLGAASTLSTIGTALALQSMAVSSGAPVYALVNCYEVGGNVTAILLKSYEKEE